MEKLYVPFLNCGHKAFVDGTCLHPNNATPECHQFICPIKAARQSDPTLLSEPIYNLQGKVIATGKITFDKSQSG